MSFHWFRTVFWLIPTIAVYTIVLGTASVASSLVGDRSTYQQDPANTREALREIGLDLDEGADIILVKPAGPHLDIVAAAAAMSTVPVAAYQISGEYSQIVAAADRGWIDRERAMLESLLHITRAGAGIILTDFALEAARALSGGRTP